MGQKQSSFLFSTTRKTYPAAPVIIAVLPSRRPPRAVLAMTTTGGAIAEKNVQGTLKVPCSIPKRTIWTARIDELSLNQEVALSQGNEHGHTVV